MGCIKYKKGYKYQLVEPYIVDIPIKPVSNIASPSDFIVLTIEGQLTIKKDMLGMVLPGRQSIH